MAQNDLPEEEYKEILSKLRAKPENKMCIDCPAKNPNWATLTYGAFLCMDCAAHHRSMGVHLTFVRSTVLDKWSKTEVKRMEVGGNGRARAFFKQHGIQDMKNKYTTLAAKQYRMQLDQLCRGDTDDWNVAHEVHEPEPVASPPLRVSAPATSPLSPLSPTTPVTPVTPVTPASPLSPGEPRPAAKPAASTPATAATISGGLGRRPATGAKKKGLGGAGIVKHAAGSIQVTSGPVPEPEEEKPQPVAATTSTPQAKKGPDFTGCGSDGMVTGKKDVLAAPVVHEQKHYTKSGPDFGGLGSTASVAPTATGPDLSDIAWTVGEKVGKTKDLAAKKLDAMTSSIKGFLDDL
eukprot:TRINITY_DN54593_c0_g1_i1.p1 TRINITY_DN54593_c0_g1~~TRINITY_DN54593_c0_g1_i1.p1  ORF type:complete len:358 (-),score=60.29 TRINITY_DN54593_c0_g1_i1:117-1163(-)